MVHNMPVHKLVWVYKYVYFPSFQFFAYNSKRGIDGMLAQTISPTNSQYRPRREKVYCDKWLHDGICAFTQMGCRYKHEMPLDKETQVKLGLNHGLPAWYKRLRAVDLRGPSRASLPAPPPPPPQIQSVSASYNNTTGGGFGLNSNWRARDQVAVASQSLPGDAYQLHDPNGKSLLPSISLLISICITSLTPPCSTIPRRTLRSNWATTCCWLALCASSFC